MPFTNYKNFWDFFSILLYLVKNQHSSVFFDAFRLKWNRFELPNRSILNQGKRNGFLFVHYSYSKIFLFIYPIHVMNMTNILFATIPLGLIVHDGVKALYPLDCPAIHHSQHQPTNKLTKNTIRLFCGHKRRTIWFYLPNELSGPSAMKLFELSSNACANSTGGRDVSVNGDLFPNGIRNSFKIYPSSVIISCSSTG